MVRVLSLFLLFFFNHVVFGQKVNFDAKIKVVYDSTLRLGEKFKKEQRFVLVGNDVDYYFAAEQNFLNDTKQYEASGFDLQSISDYFQERVFKLGANYHVFFSYIGFRCVHILTPSAYFVTVEICRRLIFIIEVCTGCTGHRNGSVIPCKGEPVGVTKLIFAI